MKLERRGNARVDLLMNDMVRLEVRSRVRLLDISLSGALIACDTPFPVGAQGHLRIGLAALPFSAEMEVRREQSGPRRPLAAGLGAVFASMDDGSRRSLEEFLRRASE
jgi:hypothetical protein